MEVNCRRGGELCHQHGFPRIFGQQMQYLTFKEVTFISSILSQSFFIKKRETEPRICGDAACKM
jgi:hypothetical protein